jgi:hypothetical protein
MVGGLGRVRRGIASAVCKQLGEVLDILVSLTPGWAGMIGWRGGIPKGMMKSNFSFLYK